MDESKYMPSVCASWEVRRAALNLKGKTALRDREAFMQGVLATATATCVMDHGRAGQIGFLAMVDRLAAFMDEQASRKVE